MTRKRNINFGFLPARPTRADLRKSRREFKAAVKRKTREISAEYKRLRKAAREAKPAPGIGGKQKLEQLFHEVYGQNPRQLPEFTAKQMAAIRKLLRGKTIMAKKRKSKKKKNSRKGKMPAGLKSVLGPEAAREGEAAESPAQTAQPSNPRAHANRDSLSLPHPQSEGSQASAAAGESSAQSQADHTEGLHGLADSQGGKRGAASDGQARARGQALAQPFMLEIRGPDSDLLLFISLYDFLRRMYVQEWTADEYGFEELQIEVNGAPLLPKSQGSA